MLGTNKALCASLPNGSCFTWHMQPFTALTFFHTSFQNRHCLQKEHNQWDKIGGSLQRAPQNANGSQFLLLLRKILLLENKSKPKTKSKSKINIIWSSNCLKSNRSRSMHHNILIFDCVFIKKWAWWSLYEHQEGDELSRKYTQTFPWFRRSF